MGIKSKSNYRIDIYLKEDCINRDKKCITCRKYSCYEKKNSN